MSNKYITYSILLALNVLFLLTGYLFGRLAKLTGVSSYDHIEKPKSFFQQQQEQSSQKVSIDSTKIVTNISTKGLERKYTDLGSKKESSEDISSSINKLKNMKG